MVLVYVLYGVIVFQCFLFILYFSGNWFRMSLLLEFTQLSFRVFLCIFKSMLRWILPKQRKSVRDDIALVTGAASGIGRLMAIDLAKKGKLLWNLSEFFPNIQNNNMQKHSYFRNNMHDRRNIRYGKFFDSTDY